MFLILIANQLFCLPMGSLAVHSKELQALQIRKFRQPLHRHDVWPFLALYAADLAVILYYATRFQWCV